MQIYLIYLCTTNTNLKSKKDTKYRRINNAVFIEIVLSETKISLLKAKYNKIL